MITKNRPGMGFEVNIRSRKGEQSGATASMDAPFCIAVLGDFSGKSWEPASAERPLAKRWLVSIDRDNFDEVLARIGLTIEIPTESNNGSIHIDIGNLDDFHPDALYEKLEIFSRLRSIRRRLNDKSTFAAAAQELMPGSSGASATANNAALQSAATGNLLDNVLGSTRQSPASLEEIVQSGGIDQLIRDIVAPYVEPAADPRQTEMVEAVDSAITAQMRHILHHPRFQRMEAVWRSLYFLVSGAETGSTLKIHLLDVTRQELEQDLAGEAEASVLHKLFCEPVANDVPWSLLVGDFVFEDRIGDVLLLSQLGSIAEQAGAVFIGGARETLAGCASFAESPDPDDWRHAIKPGVANAWSLLRESPVSEFIGLTLPRFLLRVPYGQSSNPIESFTFEELEGGRVEHEHYLWGNAAYFKALQMTAAFAQHGWDMRPADAAEIDNLPVAYFSDDGEKAQLPCAEIFMTEKGGHRLSSHGLMALWSVKNSDTVRSSDFGSLADDHHELRGRWKP